jgi:hypothetical protein
VIYAVGILVVVSAAVDLCLMWWWGVEGTISRQITELSCRYPIVPFLAGMIAAHFWWTQS